MNTPRFNPVGPEQKYPDSAQPISNNPRGVDQLHQNSDLDSSKFSQHHSLGYLPNQASPGDHVHDGSTSKQFQNLVILGSLTVLGKNNFIQWTPDINNEGSATFTTLDGWWFSIGDLAFFNIYFTVNNAGSGTNNITITLPFTPYRGSANRRQIYNGAISDAIGTGGQVGPLACWTFAGGTTGIDKIVMSNGTTLQGQHLASGSILSIQGNSRIA